MAEALLALEDVRAGYGDAVVPRRHHDCCAPMGGASPSWDAMGVGKSTLLLTIMGFTRVSPRRGHLARGARSRMLERIGARAQTGLAGWRRSAIFSLRLASRKI